VSFLFETRDVDVRTRAWVRERLDEGRGGWVYGAAGSGKSHAVHLALEEGLRVDVTSGPLLGQRFAADLARQLGPDGRGLLEAVRSGGLTAALERAEHAVNGHPLIVDGADRLLGDPAWSLDEPATALWQHEKQEVLSWLSDRLKRTPTFLVGRRRPPGDVPNHRHQTSKGAPPIVLKETLDGRREWDQLASMAGGNPAILTLARALVPLLPAVAFNDLVEQASEGEVYLLLQRLGRAFQANAPPSWQQALALLAALGEAPRDIVEASLRERPGRGLSEPDLDTSVQEASALDRLLELGLVEARPYGLSLLPALVDADALRPLTQQERSDLLPSVAPRLLARVNDLRSLQPEHADRVLRAHAIFVELGDMANAERTAVLHVHGLVDLARRTSLDKQYDRAWSQYDSVFRMLQMGSWGLDDEVGRRLRSYVRHYRAWNGSMAGALDDAVCLVEYQAAVEGWPQNALWHQRAVQGMIRLGRLVDARQAIKNAYEWVGEHPRRDELLRVRPARTALSAGAPLLALELIEPVLDVSAELYPGVADGRDELLRLWAAGIPLAELPFHTGTGVNGAEGRVVLLRPAKVSVERAANGWVARLPELAKDARAPAPLAAVEALGLHLGEEARRLISTPSSRLSDPDVRRKGHLLSLLDALNSDIGLEHRTDRWLVGRIEQGCFLPVMRDLPQVEVPPALLPESTEGLYFAQVPVYRDGAPSGPVAALEPAGSGRSLDDLIELLARLSRDAP